MALGAHGQVLASQPLAAFWSQFSQPCRHASSEHFPPTHKDVALGRLQANPQEPQFAGSLSVSMHAPLQQA